MCCLLGNNKGNRITDSQWIGGCDNRIECRKLKWCRVKIQFNLIFRQFSIRVDYRLAGIHDRQQPFTSLSQLNFLATHLRFTYLQSANLNKLTTSIESLCLPEDILTSPRALEMFRKNSRELNPSFNGLEKQLRHQRNKPLIATVQATRVLLLSVHMLTEDILVIHHDLRQVSMCHQVIYMRSPPSSHETFI